MACSATTVLPTFVGSLTKFICLEASLSTPTEQRERNTTTTMEMRLTLDDEVPVDKTVQGLGDTALEAMFIGYSVVAVARRQLKTIIKDLEVISNMDGANLVYNSIIQGNPAVVLIFADQAGSLTQSFALEVSCKPGEVLLDVAQGCSGMIEDTTRPFCQNGGCYNCEVEILEASELGMEENVVRACLFEVPEGVDELTLVQMTSEEAYGDML